MSKQEENLLRLLTPNVWNVHIKGNMEIAMENGSEEFLIGVSEHFNLDIDRITVGRFYNILEYLKKKEKNG